jgi:glyoxylase-like metal-dependent hydrolase (beta-lactamase superfamily II)
MSADTDAGQVGSSTVRAADEVIEYALASADLRPHVTAFFDEPTNTASYVVRDPGSRSCAIVDSVLDFDAAAGRTATNAADAIVAFVRESGLTVEWILETHVHADHLSAAPYLKEKLGGALGIGENIRVVQEIFGKVFNAGTEFQRDGSQFDHLFTDGERFSIGELGAIALHTPGHTPACMTYVIGDAAFVGDTLFMPDFGTARADFPGGDAHKLYRSAKRVLSLPDATRLFLCHDYKAPGRAEWAWETTVAAQRQHNVHMHDGVSEDDFVAMRTARDAKLGMPKLILPSVQVNMRAGGLPPSEDDGQRYLKIPLNKL